MEAYGISSFVILKTSRAGEFPEKEFPESIFLKNVLLLYSDIFMFQKIQNYEKYHLQKSTFFRLRDLQKNITFSNIFELFCLFPMNSNSF